MKLKTVSLKSYYVYFSVIFIAECCLCHIPFLHEDGRIVDKQLNKCVVFIVKK